VRTTGGRGKYQTQLSDADREGLGRIVALFGEYIDLAPIGFYRTMSAADVWLKLVIQVCVTGSARHWIRLLNDQAKCKKFERAFSLKSLDRHQYSVAYMADTLRRYSATRFPKQGAQRLKKALESPGVFQDGKLVLLEQLSHENHPYETRTLLMERCPVFGMKLASNFMIGVGLSHDVIALDSRVVGLLKTYFDYNYDASQIQSSRHRYLSLESALRELCQERNVSLATLDRVLFHFSTIGAIELAMEYPQVMRDAG
jgi:thermostable 8-oxoguanine DNA glycosylase